MIVACQWNTSSPTGPIINIPPCNIKYDGITLSGSDFMSIYWKEKKKKRSNIKAKKTKKPSRTSPKCPDPCTRSPNHHSRRLLQLVLKLASMLNLLQADEFIIFRFLWRVEAGKWVDSNLVVRDYYRRCRKSGDLSGGPWALWESSSKPWNDVLEGRKRRKITAGLSEGGWDWWRMIWSVWMALGVAAEGWACMGMYIKEMRREYLWGQMPMVPF